MARTKPWPCTPVPAADHESRDGFRASFSSFLWTTKPPSSKPFFLIASATRRASSAGEKPVLACGNFFFFRGNCRIRVDREWFRSKIIPPPHPSLNRYSLLHVGIIMFEIHFSTYFHFIFRFTIHCLLIRSVLFRFVCSSARCPFANNIKRSTTVASVMNTPPRGTC